eukprot:1144545-Pelagomonas_calceolata.AAC.10
METSTVSGVMAAYAQQSSSLAQEGPRESLARTKGCMQPHDCGVSLCAGAGFQREGGWEWAWEAREDEGGCEFRRIISVHA